VRLATTTALLVVVAAGCRRSVGGNVVAAQRGQAHRGKLRQTAEATPQAKGPGQQTRVYDRAVNLGYAEVSRGVDMTYNFLLIVVLLT